MESYFLVRGTNELTWRRLTHAHLLSISTACRSRVHDRHPLGAPLCDRHFATDSECRAEDGGCLVLGGGDCARQLQQINVPTKGIASQPGWRETHEEGMLTWTNLRERHFMGDGYDSIGKRRSLALRRSVDGASS